MMIIPIFDFIKHIILNIIIVIIIYYLFIIIYYLLLLFKARNKIKKMIQMDRL